MSDKLNIKNKKAFRDYELLDRYVAGIQLYGTEIKSIRGGKASLNDAYCVLLPAPNNPANFEIWIKMHIAEYSHGNLLNHDPKRSRKLLLNRREIDKIAKKVVKSALTVIPTKLFLNDKGLVKIEIAVASGKKSHDKRQDLKKSDDKREMDRLKKLKN
jgi:SsrA-binding protein